MDAARQILEELRQGNLRFLRAPDEPRHGCDAARRRAVAAGQAPRAAVLACADSRVPPEVVFDQGIGDLFVVRVAGNVVDELVLGSVEFAVATLGCRLVLVLGHSRCGAVAATVDAVEGAEVGSPHLQAIVERARPAVLAARPADGGSLRSVWIDRAVRENTRHSARALQQGSSLLDRAIRDQGVLIASAHYSLDTGEVEFHED